ncbi:hypothetical protein LOAG_11581 [Loa loa]|uniref:Uncharacterized protein n=1 Tax=Loa loa TaxID=7209 RepID=A0A1S0TMV9_LOALO|nr:hypothetical protein LOAG_11581 [Loa loa]EFO16923.1 hypothetical protein LOAG_11581 [Loa loa]
MYRKKDKRKQEEKVIPSKPPENFVAHIGLYMYHDPARILSRTEQGNLLYKKSVQLFRSDEHENRIGEEYDQSEDTNCVENTKTFNFSRGNKTNVNGEGK